MPNGREDPLVGFHFAVDIQGVVTGYFTECSCLGSEHEVIEPVRHEPPREGEDAHDAEECCGQNGSDACRQGRVTVWFRHGCCTTLTRPSHQSARFRGAVAAHRGVRPPRRCYSIASSVLLALHPRLPPRNSLLPGTRLHFCSISQWRRRFCHGHAHPGEKAGPIRRT